MMDIREYMRRQTELAEKIGATFIVFYFDILNKMISVRLAHPNGTYTTEQAVLESLNHPHLIIMEEIDLLDTESLLVYTSM